MTDVDVVIKAKLQGQAALEEGKFMVARIQDAIESLRTAEAAGLPVDRAMQDAISRIAERAVLAGATIDEMRKQMADARQALVHYTEAVAAGMPFDEAQKAVLNDVAEEYRQVARDALEAAGAQDAAAEGSTAASAAAAGGLPGWLAMAAVIAAVVAVLSPFIILIGSAAVILTAFAVAGAGTLTLLAGLAGGFAAIGAAVLLLGGGSGASGAADALAKATSKLSNAQQDLIEFDAAYKGHLTILQQQRREQLVENITNDQIAYNNALAASQGPFAVLLSQLNKMKDTLAAQAAPLAALITQWVAGAIPAVTQFGQAAITWFGDRLPGVLKAISGIIKDLTPDFAAFAQFLGGFVDKIFSLTSIGPEGTIKPLAASFEDGIRLMIGAAEGLLTNLGNLSEWFLVRLPVYGPIVLQIFSALGGIVQWATQQFGNLADWLVENWPAITALVAAAIKDIKDQWAQWAPVVGPMIASMLPALGALLMFVASHAGALVPIFLAVAGMVLFASGMFLILIGSLESVIEWFENLSITINNWKTQGIEDIRQFLSALNSVPGVHVPLPALPGQGGPASIGGRHGGHLIYGATGFEGTVYSPTLLMAGEGGTAEDVSIRPRGSGGAGMIVHVHIGSFYGDGPGLDRLTMAIAQRLSYVTGR